MSIRKLPSGKWKPLVRGFDGAWLPLGSFATKNEAERVEQKAKLDLKSGQRLTATNQKVRVGEFFIEWFKSGANGRASTGWKGDQLRMYEQYVHPVIGEMRLDKVLPVHIGNVLQLAAEIGRSPQTRLHVYNLLHKVFKDAVDKFEALTRNPVKRDLRPSVPEKESAHLKVDEAILLLKHVDGKPFELAIWLHLFVGMRVAEIQALTWSNVDLELGLVRIRATYVRKEKRMQDYPKGKKWHSVAMPPELLALLTKEFGQGQDRQAFVVASPRNAMLSYDGFLKALKRYCVELGLHEIATHGLRHSAPGIYMAHGATRDDIYRLFKHSSPTVTERYIHDKGERVQEIARVIRLFPSPSEGTKDSQTILAGSNSDVAQNVARKPT